MSTLSRSLTCLISLGCSLSSGCTADDVGDANTQAGTEADGTNSGSNSNTNSASNTNTNTNSGDGDGAPGDGDGTPGDGDGAPGDGDGTPGDGDGTPGDGDGDGTMGLPGMPGDDPNCPDQSLVGELLPVTIMGSNNGGEDGLQASCGSPGGEDLAFTWSAPADATYRIDTLGSDFDTVLAVYQGSCINAPELACNDDAPGAGATSAVNLALAQGDEVTIYVDGYDDSEVGNYVLHISELICQPVADLGSAVPVTQQGLLDAGVGQDIGGCGGDGNDVSFTWTAPSDGNFVFDTFGSMYDTVLYVRDGGCGGAELDCNDEFENTQSQVSIDLTAGQSVYIVVDAFDDLQMGEYVLNIGMN
jgi:hypothetical protein